MAKPAHSLRTIFGLNVRIARTRKRWTQEELGEQIQRDQSFVSLIENGETAPSLDTVERIAKVLEVRASELLDEQLGRR